MTILAHVSDLHLDGTDRAHSRAERVFAYLRDLPAPPDAVLVTGDIADHGAASEYEAARKLFDLPFPVLAGPGNHDARDVFRTVLLGEAASLGPVNSAHRAGDLAVLMADSTIPGEDDGALASETLEWLESELSAVDGRPTVIAFHHPPVLTHHPLADGWPLLNPGELASLLQAHPHVVAVLTGHAHTAAAASFAGRPLIVAPATTWTLQFPFESAEPGNPELPPGLALHLYVGGHFITHFRHLS